MKQYVITISRQFGSLGHAIAKKLSKDLDVMFYDRDLLEATAKRLGLPASYISESEENSGSMYLKMQYPLGMEMAGIRDEIFLVQKNIIEDLANQSSCIIVGRCSESILADRENILRAYIYAPYSVRLKNCVETLEMSEAAAKKMIREVDRSRALYHRRYCPEMKDSFTNHDIMIDSSKFGVDGTACLLANLAREMFRD